MVAKNRTIETAIFDLDSIVYKAGFAGEKKTIEVLDKSSDKVFKFKNRTEFWGRGKKIGGWLATENTKREERGESPLERDNFEIVDVQSAEPIAHVLSTVKKMISHPMELLGAKHFKGYIGGKAKPLWRLENSHLLEYKGDRKDSLPPVYKDDIIKYLKNVWGAEVIENGFEVDDWVVMEAYKSPEDSVVISFDKDSLGCPILVYNPDRQGMGIVDGRCFGETFWDSKRSEFDGHGRKFFYTQVVFGDPVDNYKANSASEVLWGKKSAYESLKDAETDRECFQVIKDVFQHLYPEKKVIQSWRGEEIEIDWLFVASEMWDMARMWRSEDDLVRLPEVLDKFKLLEDYS